MRRLLQEIFARTIAALPARESPQRMTPCQAMHHGLAAPGQEASLEISRLPQDGKLRDRSIAVGGLSLFVTPKCENTAARCRKILRRAFFSWAAWSGAREKFALLNWKADLRRKTAHVRETFFDLAGMMIGREG
ncbi:MAG: hypothetical protein M3X11_03295 [Acidobacteriota bacterium]|nr:hypothetical protein [Acidobacteriota bacterium]